MDYEYNIVAYQSQTICNREFPDDVNYSQIPVSINFIFVVDFKNKLYYIVVYLPSIPSFMTSFTFHDKALCTVIPNH